INMTTFIIARTKLSVV
ncbi:Phosphoserine aminotransferase, partial [Haemophilus influenzae]